MSAVDSSPQTNVLFPQDDSYLIRPEDSIEIVSHKIAQAIALSMHELAATYQKKLQALFRAPDKDTIRSLLLQGPWDIEDFREQCEEHGFTTLLSIDISPPTLKKEQSPFDFVQKACSLFSIIGSGEAIRMAQYQGLALCLGKETFDAAFSSSALGSVNFCVENALSLQPLCYLSHILRSDLHPKRLGDAVYLSSGKQECHALITGHYSLTAFRLKPDVSFNDLHQHIHNGQMHRLFARGRSRCSMEALTEVVKGLLKYLGLACEESHSPIASASGSIWPLNARTIRWLAKVKGQADDIRLRCILKKG